MMLIAWGISNPNIDITEKIKHRILNFQINWLNANKISLNVDKTELVLFKPLRKKLDENVTIKLKGKKLDLSSSVKYLGIRIDSNLNWKEHVNTVAIKLNRANGLLSKLRHFVNQSTLKSIYYAIFESNFNYASIVWAQKITSSHRLFLLQKKAIRIINFSDRLAHTNPLFYNSKIIKLPDKVSIENCCFISKSLSNFLPPSFNNWFLFSASFHSHDLRSSDLGVLKVPSYTTTSHGRFSFKINAIYTWNQIQYQFKDLLLSNLKTNKIKDTLTNYFLNSYY